MCFVSYFCVLCVFFFFYKQKTAYEMRISDWSSDVCSSDLVLGFEMTVKAAMGQPRRLHDLRHGDGIEALLAKEPAGRVQDAQAVLRHLFPTDLHVPFSSSVDMGSHL